CRRPGGSCVPAALPALTAQAERLIELGADELAGLPAADLRAAARTDRDDALLVVHPDRLAASTLATLVERAGKRAFVVTDMGDVDEFAPIMPLPAAPVRVSAWLRGSGTSRWTARTPTRRPSSGAR